LNEKEKKSFTINLLRVRKAQKGETIKSMSERVGNVLNEEITAVINACEIDEKLKKGEDVKVVIKYPYPVD